MAWTLVQSQEAHGNTGATASVTLTGATTAGNLLVLLVDAGKNPGDVTFTPPANWVQAGTTQHDDIFIAISGTGYYYPNCPAGITTVSVTISTTVSAWHIAVLEFSGGATTSPLDGQSVRTQAATTTPSSGAITTTANGDLLVGWISEDDVNGAYTLTQPGGWTALARNQDANQWSSLYVAYTTQATAGSASYAPTLTSTATDSVIGVMAFLAAGGGGGSTVNGIAESDGQGSNTASATLATPAQSNGQGQAQAQATIATAGESAGSGTAQATATLATAAESDGSGQNSASATVFPTAAQSDGQGQQTASATLSTSATSEGHAADAAQAAPIVLPFGAVSAGHAADVAVMPSNIAAGSVALDDALAHVVTLSDALAHVVTLTDVAAGVVTVSDSPAE